MQKLCVLNLMLCYLTIKIAEKRFPIILGKGLQRK